jgi:Flp pilus assembly pilin Flp
VTPTEPELDVSHLTVHTCPPPARTDLHPAGTDRTTPPMPTGAVVVPVPAPPVLTLVPAVPSPPAVARTVTPTGTPTEAATDAASNEDGSLVTEYGLLAVVAATVAGVLISWASSGALATFFGQLLQHARSLVVS